MPPEEMEEQLRLEERIAAYSEVCLFLYPDERIKVDVALKQQFNRVDLWDCSIKDKLEEKIDIVEDLMNRLLNIQTTMELTESLKVMHI